MELDPSVPAATTGAVVSPYYGNDTTQPGTPGNIAHAEYNGGCGTNGVGVVTFYLIPGTTSASGMSAFSDQGFFIVVP